MPRRLGQHFLRREAALRLVDEIAPRESDVFLEIGPGEGALTLPLAARCRQVVAVELDARLAERLRARAPENVRIVEGDALRVALSSLVPEGGRLAANLPYYISSPLLRSFLGLRGRVSDLHVMLQQEVARRWDPLESTCRHASLSIL